MNTFEANIADGPFQPTFESLRGFQTPQWFRDAKFGIWSHWGPQSVPRFGDWYARNMYREGSDQYRYHVRTYGDPKTFGYKDLVQLWKAENFDPDGLMRLYANAGAKYFVGQAMHHDHFFNYDSALHNWNSVRVGPHKDIVALWKAAAARHNLPFGLTEHLGATFSWWAVNKRYDGADPAHEDLYLPNREHYKESDPAPQVDPWYTGNAWWHQRWFDCIKEVVDKYQPDLLYSDGPPPFGEAGYAPGLHLVAHLYNTSAGLHGGENQAVYNQKDRRPEIYSIGVLDIERSQEPDIKPEPWQTDTSVGDWFYNVRDVYKTPQHVVELLVDIVAKNGNLLLNIPQRPDGTLDPECTYLLEELAGWTGTCGEGIYGTRPFRVSGEGASRVHIEGFKEAAVEWTSADFRFTRKDNTVYAFQPRWPDNDVAVIQSLTPAEKVKRVRLLGFGEVPFEQPYGVLAVRLPSQRPTGYVNCLALELVETRVTA